jgi:hypothetical protein
MRVRFYGHIGRLSGYGRAAADLCMSLLATGEVDLEIAPIGKTSVEEARLALERYQSLRACLRRDDELVTTTPDVCIVHTLPLDCVRVKEFVTSNLNLHPNIPWIAYTTWEGTGLAPMAVLQSLIGFDQVWTPSNSSWRSLGGGGVIVPHAFDPAELEERRKPRQVATTDPRYRFRYFGAWNSRKNPAGIIRAWAMAFSPNDNVALSIHSTNATKEAFAVALHQTGLAAQEMASVHLVTEQIPWAEYLAVTRLTDCFVTATRGEAWNLPAFDAMLAGRHIIHPKHMGADDFLFGGTTAELYAGMDQPATVDVQVTERMADGVKMSVVGAQGLTSRSCWIEPDLTQLADAMHDAYTHGTNHLTLDYDPADRFSYQAVGKTALSALEDL